MRHFFDLWMALMWATLLAPLMVFIAIAIWLDSGSPILYTPLMLGQHGKLFRLLRFRTMVEDGEGRSIVTERLTRVGRFVRKVSLDHLPTLLNVLNGTITLIGPRPMEPENVDLSEAE